MTFIPILALAADTLLVRPVGVPTPWYSVASGILSIVVTLLLLGIAVALLGMARALKGAESRLGGSMKGLTDELLPLARNLNQIALQLSEVTTAVRGDLQRVSETIGAVDDAVRDALDAGESRLAQLGTLVDAVQDEAQAVVGSATGVMRGMRTGAGTLAKSFFSRAGQGRPARSGPRRPRADRMSGDREALELEESEILARLAALEAAFAARDDDEMAAVEDDVRAGAARQSFDPYAFADDRDDDDDDDEPDDGDDLYDDDEALSDDDALDRDDDEDDEQDDDEQDDDEDDESDEHDDIDYDDDGDDDDDDDDTDDDRPDDGVVRTRIIDAQPRTGGPRIRQDRRA